MSFQYIQRFVPYLICSQNESQNGELKQADLTVDYRPNTQILYNFSRQIICPSLVYIFEKMTFLYFDIVKEISLTHTKCVKPSVCLFFLAAREKSKKSKCFPFLIVVVVYHDIRSFQWEEKRSLM